jgi:hypothetical protein
MMSPKWTLDELAHAGTDHLDADFVVGYDRKQGLPSPAHRLRGPRLLVRATCVRHLHLSPEVMR